jgi:hypothetical protein
MKLSEEDKAIVREVAEVFRDPSTGTLAKVLWMKSAGKPVERTGDMAMTKIGAFWKGKPGSKAKITGKIKLGEADEIRVGLFENEKRPDKPTDPDYVLLQMTDDREGWTR